MGAIRKLEAGAGAADTDRFRNLDGAVGTETGSVGREDGGGSAVFRELLTRSNLRCWRSSSSCFRIDF